MTDRIYSLPLSSAGLSKAFTDSTSAQGSIAGLGNDTPSLAEQVKSFTQSLTGAATASSSQTARLENATLDFAREVKALRMGSLDQPKAAIEAQIEAAVAKGNFAADGLPTPFDTLDRITTALSVAANTLSELSAAPLVAASPVGEK
jgi:hypothetical protein